MKASTEITKIAPALVAIQKAMETVTKSAVNPYYKSKYADINSFLEVAIPVINANGCSLLQPTYSDATGHFVETYIIHESGQFVASDPLRLELDKTDMQKLGSSITYARRYQVQSLLGMRGEDDDAEESMNRNKAASKAPSASKTEVSPVASETKPTDTKLEKPKSGFAAYKAEKAPTNENASDQKLVATSNGLF